MTNQANRMQLRGVNLGGWLVLERWITPSLFQGTNARDEYTFMQSSGALQKLAHHRQTFITEEDFSWLARHGVDIVRIPVGYWILASDAPYQQGIGFLDQAFQWAEQYGLRVLVDLHAAPGSQNGNDHSGRIGPIRWHNDSRNQERSIDILARLAERYKKSPSFWGIELLNEPRPGRLNRTLRNFYRHAYRRLKVVVPPSVHVVFSDAFRPLAMTGALFGRGSMDIHWYHFTMALHRSLPLKGYFWLLRTRSVFIRMLQIFQPVIIGEWSGVLDGSTVQGLSQPERRRLYERHVQCQRHAYRHAAAVFYWTYKTENTDIWNFRHSTESGICIY